MAFNIVLMQPEIPNNTGNIGRLSLATGSTLHLVQPFGFELSDKRLKRAGLDYWKHLKVIIYENTEEFYHKNQDAKMIYFSSQATASHWDIKYSDDLFLVFGKESVGLPETITNHPKNQLCKIPMFSEHIRSLNLANAVSIVLYEGLRQLQ